MNRRQAGAEPSSRLVGRSKEEADMRSLLLSLLDTPRAKQALNQYSRGSADEV
jgi:hypothetical protein